MDATGGVSRIDEDFYATWDAVMNRLEVAEVYKAGVREDLKARNQVAHAGNTREIRQPSDRTERALDIFSHLNVS